jgi:hypothetical protein
MEPSLHELWEGAARSPFVPTIGKDGQFWVGMLLLILGTLLAGFFGLSKLQTSCTSLKYLLTDTRSITCKYSTHRTPSFPGDWVGAVGSERLKWHADDISFGAVYMICAVGVYV